MNFFKNNNDKLSELYEESSVGTKECPSSLDDKLQKGCGNSRWGCWLCPVVTKDKSLEGFINSGYQWLKPLLDFREKLIIERDQFINRYHASFKISKNKNIATLVKYRFIDLHEKNGIYYLPKKQNRKEIIFGSISLDGKWLVSNENKYQIISEKEYKKRVDQKMFNPYLENNKNLLKFVIKRDKNLSNNKLSIIGLGPYTLMYRKKILTDLKMSRLQMKNYDVEIINDTEINYIENIFKIVNDTLYQNGYLDETMKN